LLAALDGSGLEKVVAQSPTELEPVKAVVT
jgi:hypothetical protein